MHPHNVETKRELKTAAESVCVEEKQNVCVTSQLVIAKSFPIQLLKSCDMHGHNAKVIARVFSSHALDRSRSKTGAKREAITVIFSPSSLLKVCARLGLA